MSGCLRICALLACAALEAAAVDWSILAPGRCLTDAARVIDEEARAALEKYCAAMEAATGARMGMVLVTSLEGEPIDAAAGSLFRSWDAGNPNRVLLLVVTAERHARLHVAPALSAHIRDGFRRDLISAMAPELRAEHYGQALLAATHAIGSEIARVRRLDPAALPPRPLFEPHPLRVSWLAVGAGVLLLAWLAYVLLRRGRAVLRGRTTWGGRGSGGFGAFDSGDGFAGFGGCDSGGRRPLGDW